MTGWCVFSASTTKSAAVIERWCAAWEKQLARDFCPDYSRVAVDVAFYDDKSKIPAGAPTLAIADRGKVSGALAYHSQDTDGRVVAVLGVLDCEEDGVEPSSAGSHELLEGTFDPFVNKWYDMPDGRREMSGEVSDAVQDQTYEIDGVAVSSYVLPDWFNDRPEAGAKFDRGGILRAPFTRTSGGYFVTRAANGTTTQDGVRPSYKSPDGRGARRLMADVAATLDGVPGKPPLDEHTLAAVRAESHKLGGGVALIVHDVVRRAKAAC